MRATSRTLPRTVARRLRHPALALLLVVPVLASASTQVARAVPPPTRPSIVLILTDDQRFDSLWAMPQTRQFVVGPGVKFQNGFVVDPLCCPSRASILAGAYPHTTGIYQNSPPHGGFADFNDTTTIATQLETAGYRTDLVGKYFNGYAKQTYIPPGWSRWTAFDGPSYVSAAYYNYLLNTDGNVRSVGHVHGDYSTDLLADHAVSFIQDTASWRPLFLYFAPFAPHEPAVSAPRDRKRFKHLKPYRPPNFNEKNVRDKPAYIRKLPRLDRAAIKRIDTFHERQYRSLLAVDDAVKRIVDALRATGRLSNTMIVFTSDNGISLGEHRWVDKKLDPYEESIRVPFAVRYDPLTQGAPDLPNLALNIDLAPTFAALAGTTMPGSEGLNLLPILNGSKLGDPSAWRRSFLIENSQAAPGQGPRVSVPAYCGVRSTRYLFVHYDTGERELYDLGRDPFELQNIVARTRYSSVVHRMAVRADQLCQPPPPGFGGS
jgi:N-acetylglucosamine-6-sulfatase